MEEKCNFMKDSATENKQILKIVSDDDSSDSDSESEESDRDEGLTLNKHILSEIADAQFLTLHEEELKIVKYLRDNMGEAEKEGEKEKEKGESMSQKLLVFDLDGTLVKVEGILDDYDFYVNIRPYTQSMLAQLSKLYTILIFTSSTNKYAQKVVSKIDPQGIYIYKIYSRNDCHKAESEFFIKDLRVLGRDLNEVVIVDDLIISFAYQLDNGILVKEYKGEPTDKELLWLTKYLVALATIEDVRIRNSMVFRFNKLLDRVFLA